MVCINVFFWQLSFGCRYQQQRKRKGSEIDAGLVGHIHLDEVIGFLLCQISAYLNFATYLNLDIGASMSLSHAFY